MDGYWDDNDGGDRKRGGMTSQYFIPGYGGGQNGGDSKSNSYDGDILTESILASGMATYKRGF